MPSWRRPLIRPRKRVPQPCHQNLPGAVRTLPRFVDPPPFGSEEFLNLIQLKRMDLLGSLQLLFRRDRDRDQASPGDAHQARWHRRSGECRGIEDHDRTKRCTAR